jgi:glycosyltransferase involved in cell wall biosynthesis
VKILQIIYESYGNPFGVGGAGVRAYEIYGRLRDRHKTTFLCMKYPGARDGEIQGVRHVFVGTESKSLPKSVLAFTVQAARFVHRFGRDFDIIVENFLPSTPFFSRFLSKTPVILQIQGVMYGHLFKKFNPLYSLPMYALEKFYPPLHDRFIFVSDVTRAKVMRGITRPVKLCRVIPNGVNEDLLAAETKEEDYILFFSRIDAYTKGIDILLAAFENLAQEFPGVRLVMAGYEFDSVERLVSGLPAGVKKRVEYAGFLTGAQKTALLTGALIVVLPSRHESSPVSIVEAAACGKPLVVSDIEEMSFVEENNFGVRFPSGSVKGLTDKLALLLRDGGLRNNLGRKGREYSGKLLWSSIAKEFENTLELTTDEKK